MFENTWIRLAIFISVLVLMALAESLFPKRDRNLPRKTRWTTNLGITAINVAVLRLLGPISAVAAANYALDNGWGLLSHLPIPLPFYVEVILAIVILDLAIYFQHVMSHKLPILWRFHKVHHADRDIDVTTGIRFHPVEAALSMIYKCGVILLLGPATLAVIVFEILLNASPMFNHANVSLPKSVDRLLRLIIVSPDMHRVHHSEIPQETNSNYGFFLSIWDRIFRTYIPQPQKGHQDMVIGLSEYQTDKPASFLWSIKIPFYSPEK